MLARAPRPAPGRSPAAQAASYGERLLGELGLAAALDPEADHPALAWRRAGLLEITGAPDGPGLCAPAPLTLAAEGALAAFRAITGAPGGFSAAVLLGERARLMGLTRRGEIAPGGSCRLYRTRTGWLALNLARAEDADLLPAWLEWDPARPENLATILPERDGAELAERGRAMGLALAFEAPPCDARSWAALSHVGAAGPPAATAPRVLDLTALWAGPLAASLLQTAGAHVVKVESTRRPDGARKGHGGFYDLLNAGKDSIALDLASHEGRRALQALIENADMVLEGSRPRALRQLGINAEGWVQARPGRVWVSITAYGRGEPEAGWAGFGDDVSAAAGLTWRMREAYGGPLFAGDALADPLTGIHAALAGWALWRRGGGMAALSLAGVMGRALLMAPAPSRAQLADANRQAAADEAPLYPLRAPTAAAAGLGAHNEQWLGALTPC